ncbi:MAG: PAS domain-containing protein [Acidobacteriota bacterium]|nr:PAS domain-containing protein [Acidobacteriota bacterium]
MMRGEAKKQGANEPDALRVRQLEAELAIVKAQLQGAIERYETSAELPIEKERSIQLRVSEEPYRSLFDSIDEGFSVVKMILDENGAPVDYRFLEINRTFEQQTGLNQPVGRTARELVPDVEQHLIDTYGKVALTGEPARFEYHVASVGVWFDVYAYRVGGNESSNVAILFKNITGRKGAEERLRTSEEWLRQATEAGRVFVWEVDLITQTAKFSENVERVLGFRLPTNLEGNFAALHPEDRERQREIVERAIETGGRFDAEHRILNP